MREIKQREILKMKQQLDTAQQNLDKLAAKHSRWDITDRRTMRSWGDALTRARQQIEFLEHPMMKRYIRMCLTSLEEIDTILKTDKALLADQNRSIERMTIMEKREFYEKAIEIFMPKQSAISMLENETRAQLMYANSGNRSPQREGLTPLY